MGDLDVKIAEVSTKLDAHVNECVISKKANTQQHFWIIGIILSGFFTVIGLLFAHLNSMGGN